MFLEYSVWFLPAIILVALLLAGWQYNLLVTFKNKKTSPYSKQQRLILFLFKFIALFLILFLLLSPVKRITHKHIEKPIIVMAQDVSLSIRNHWQTNKQTNQTYLRNLEKLYNDLRKNHNVVLLKFGQETRNFDFDKTDDNNIVYEDYTTDFSELYNYVAQNFNKENLSALVLCTDAIATQGHSLLNNEEYFTCPVYSVALGDTTQRKDIQISDVRYNKICFLNESFPLEINIKANKCKGEKVALTMSYNGKTSVIKTFTINGEDFFLTIPYKETASKAGINKLFFSITKLYNESNKANNTKDIFIEVLDTKKKIIVLAVSAHPDISAIKNVAKNNNYDCEVFTEIEKANLNENYDLAVLHNLPNSPFSVNMIKQLQKKTIPLLFIVGQQTNVSYFNAVQKNIKINPLSFNAVQVVASYNNNFSAFTLDKETTNLFKDFPPLLSVSARYTYSPSLNILAYQRIGSISTDYPLIAFCLQEEQNIGYILGENIWRWRLHNYLINTSHNQTNELIGKTLQILSNKDNKKRFILDNKDIYHSNENIVVRAQLYNDNYELINTPEISFTLKQKTAYDKQNVFSDKTYTFGKTNNAYYTNLSKLPSGEYQIEAKTNFNGKTLTDKSSFVVNNISAEYNDLVAKHSDLFTLSSKTGGKMVYTQQLHKIKDYIERNEEIKPIIYENTGNKKFVSLWWYWLIIVLCLGSEWFFRKYWGRI